MLKTGSQPIKRQLQCRKNYKKKRMLDTELKWKLEPKLSKFQLLQWILKKPLKKELRLKQLQQLRK
jgi:hypothetical protein